LSVPFIPVVFIPWYFSWVICPSILQGLGCLTAGSTSPPIAVLLGLFIISITIKVIVYLSIWELEVDLSRSNVDDSVGGVKERSSQDNGGLFIFYSYVQDHETSRNITILDLYNGIVRYSLWELN
jgi:hypothetical protein